VDTADLEQDEKDAVSRALSRILRHRAQHAGLAIRSNGFCVLERVLNLREMKELRVNKKVVEEVTRTNDKQRFELRFIDGQQMIRAVQGHSLEAVEDDALGRRLLLDSGALPVACVHGTYARHVESIIARGLIAGGLGEKGQRNHIHFAPYDYTDKRVISGMRAGCEIAIYIDLRKAMVAGIPFFMSKNEVILTEGDGGVLPSKYFLSARNIKTGKELLRSPKL